MLRALLIEGSLFLLPFAAYAAFMYFSHRTLILAHWTPKAIMLLSLVALVLVAGGLLVFEQERGARPGAHYTPAQVEDGVFKPGQLK
ncbi:DUF6111 family protein [Aquabacter sp. P-9]|uniref:DUF6111 family protein n=1 Tax=Aquabacter sediminis TaxID=3029197 RepID=UPI00237DBC59|nr:DUF6111 family protein [Aquabacter sp. P-9]MDE1567922.1 DUF6111 family protein [Aquabacter sp. P-9]